jgi:hypothetical protein
MIVFRGHVMLEGNKINAVAAPFPVVGPSPVPSTQSTLTEVQKVPDSAYEMYKCNV